MDKNRQIVAKVLKRSGDIYVKKANRERNLIMVFCISTCYSMIVFVSGMIAKMSGGFYVETFGKNLYGTILYYNENIGEYIIIGVLAFCLGAITTMICTYINKNKNGKMQKLKEKRDFYEEKDI